MRYLRLPPSVCLECFQEEKVLRGVSLCSSAATCVGHSTTIKACICYLTTIERQIKITIFNVRRKCGLREE